MGDLDDSPPRSPKNVYAPFAKGAQIGNNNRQDNTIYQFIDASSMELQGNVVEEEDEPSGSGYKISLGGAAVVVSLVVLACWNSIFGSPAPGSSFPLENGERPIGSSDQAIHESTLVALDACAKVRVLKPLHCPQAVDDLYPGDVSQVAWRIHGDPGDGSKVVFNGKEGFFHMLGTAVMSVSYQDTSGNRLRVRVVHYWSRVEWADGQAKVAELRAYDDTPRPTTYKQNPNVADATVFPLVEAAFRGCAGAKSSPMPPECPESNTLPHSGKVKWRLNGSPLVNARATFDAPSGLIHVRGNYSLTVSHEVWLSGVTSETESGTYDATVSIDKGKPGVLRIQRL